jgi:hypothetical protein
MALLRWSIEGRGEWGSCRAAGQIAVLSSSNAAASRRRGWRASTPSSWWPRRRFWMNALPRITNVAVRSVRRPRIGRSRALSRRWSHSLRLFAYCVVSWRASGTSSSTTRSNGAARSVVISSGRSRPASVVSNDLVAASTLRRFDTYTSMTWPCWSTARYT